jgi:hypothetical protein
MKRIACFCFASLTCLSGCDNQPSSATKSIQPDFATTPKFEARPAEVGVGLQGQSLKDEKGIGQIIAQPAMTLFQTKQRVVFEIQIPQALELYRAGEGNGEYPKTHAEFMSKIIKANNIPLPKLPEGQVYRYRPDDEQKLWVEPKPEK